MAPRGNLPAPEVEALVKRFLDGEPGVSVKGLKGGLGFLCGPPLGAPAALPRLFVVATGGGVLLRLDPDSRDRLVENGVGVPNVGLPDWVVHLEGKEDGAFPHQNAEASGDPEEWIWVPVGDSAAFERRRPHIHEALAYCRHCLAEPRTG